MVHLKGFGRAIRLSSCAHHPQFFVLYLPLSSPDVSSTALSIGTSKMRTQLLLSVFVALMLVCIHAAPTPSQTVNHGENVSLFDTMIWDDGDFKAREGGVIARADSASQAKLQTLTAQKSNLELELQFVQQARIQIANMISSLFNASSKLDPNSAQAKQLTAAISSIQARDQQLELQSRRLDTELQVVQTEINAVSK
jgi:hypothetical protein